MPVRLNKIILATLLSAAPLVSFATTLTFDDVAVLSGFTTYDIPNGYGGLNWGNMKVLNAAGEGYAGTGYQKGLVSGSYVAFNSGGAEAGVMSVSSATAFDFDSAYLTAAWNKNLNVDVRGFRNGVLVYTETIVISDAAPTLFNFDYLGIDNLVFNSYGGVNDSDMGSGTHFALEDFTYDQTAAVPEPASLSLIGLGLIGFAAARRKARQDTA